mmetsp:Transcript_68276/g.108396  ORF Transcript_68276/g.108396 Transcript_68276/m.108396 type:complete len:234 (-) Transcript_68276:309-1010(-)
MSEKEEKEEVEDKEDENDSPKEEDNPNEMTAQQKLYYFAKRGDKEGIKEVQNHVDISAVDTTGSKTQPYVSQSTALHYAVQSGNLECVTCLFDLGAKIDVVNKLKCTPLHIAASLGYTEIAAFLIEKKADLEAKNVIQNTPLHCAVYAGHVDTVKVILDNLDDPVTSLLDQNGVGFGAVKYTAHEEMKTYLRKFFPKKANEEEVAYGNANDNVEEEEPNQLTAEGGEGDDEAP